jgi:hypothetical protein
MNVAQALRLTQTMGWPWLAFRLAYAVKIRSGHLRRRMPVKEWSSHPLGPFLKNAVLAEPQRYLEQRRNEAPTFFFNPSQRDAYRKQFESWDAHPLPGMAPLALAEDGKAGILHYFEHATARTGFPPNWHANPFTSQEAPADRHWSRIGDFECGDIKVIWEANRFGCVYDLVRAYWRTGDEGFAECFWCLVEDWKARNRPQAGVNWKCGQEISIRLMAWLFGLSGFLSARSTSPERVAELGQMIAVSADRIEKNIAYALSQKNNHGISEASGLWTVGLLFPEFRDAERWREKGRHLLEKQAMELIYDDGSFVQHSFNYHRLMLQAYTWAIRLGDLNGMPLTDRLKDRLLKACLFLYQVQDEVTGQAPNYGQNDGALILPLTNCDYRDYRPAIQSAHFLLTGKRCYPDGPWDEDLLWLYGPAAVQAPVVERKRNDLQAETGGYHTLRPDGGSGFTFVRCARYRHRPGQADMLHVDLWWRGLNIAQDPGTYSYNAPQPWNNALVGTSFHNTVTVDGQDQMDQVGRFLWLPWVTGRVRRIKESPSRFFLYWEGEHDGYRRLPCPASHVRSILKLGDEHWLIVDRLGSLGEHRYRLHWLLSDFPSVFEKERDSVTIATPEGSYRVVVGSMCGEAGISLVRADENSPRGWCSHYYQQKEPALSIAAEIRDRRGLLFSLFGPDGFTCHHENEVLDIATEKWHCAINLNMERTDNKNPNIAYACVTGQWNERFGIN